MSRRDLDHQLERVWVNFAGTAIPTRNVPAERQLPFPNITDMISEGQLLKFVLVVSKKPMFLDARQLIENTSSTDEPTSLTILKRLVGALDDLQLLEAIYGYTSDAGCKIVGIANDLSNEQSDLIWDINWEYQGKYPRVNIEVLLIQRYNRPISDLYNGDSAVIKRVSVPS